MRRTRTSSGALGSGTSLLMSGAKKIEAEKSKLL
jgi:hypothetical protein